MASTSTNKQPLLIDRVLHYVVDLNTAIIPGIDVSGTNEAALIADATSSDGAILEDVYCISRGTTEYFINLYLSSAIDYLRPSEGIFVGSFTNPLTIGEVKHWEYMPRILAPVPQVAITPEANQLKAFYIPKGKALWAAIQSNVAVNDAPLLGVQGGWY